MSLVEVMVGLVIGMIGVLVVFQTMSVWGERTSTTMSGGDARTSGAIGMYYLEQDLAQGGLGFGRTAYAGRQFTPGCIFTGTSRLAAVDIDDGGSGAPDVVTVLYANSSNPNVNYSDVALFSEDASGAGMSFSYQGHALSAGDWVVLATLAGGGQCVIRQVTSALPAVGTALNKITFNSPPGFSSGNLLYLGNRPQRARWQVNAASLERTNTDFEAAEATPQVADGVIDLQAQYGLADGTWQSADPAATDWGLVRAIRIAILVRSKQFEKENVTTVAPVWHTGTGVATDFVMADLADGTSWQRYRYEVFERTIPLRNIIWGARE